MCQYTRLELGIMNTHLNTIRKINNRCRKTKVQIYELMKGNNHTKDEMEFILMSLHSQVLMAKTPEEAYEKIKKQIYER